MDPLPPGCWALRVRPKKENNRMYRELRYDFMLVGVLLWSKV